MEKIDVERVRYPYCIVWTPIPLLTWFLPFVGHTGIGMSNGVIRDFAGPYIVTVKQNLVNNQVFNLFLKEDDMAFGNPTKYIQMDISKVNGGQQAWDRAVKHASEVYEGKMHNLFCDNCHSHVCLALNTMQYDNKENCNMAILATKLFFCGRFVSWIGFLKTWLPFAIFMSTIIALVVLL